MPVQEVLLDLAGGRGHQGGAHHDQVHKTKQGTEEHIQHTQTPLEFMKSLGNFLFGFNFLSSKVQSLRYEGG